jgi:hypothetical protein
VAKEDEAMRICREKDLRTTKLDMKLVTSPFLAW